MTKLGTEQAKSAAAENNNWHKTLPYKQKNKYPQIHVTTEVSTKDTFQWSKHVVEVDGLYAVRSVPKMTNSGCKTCVFLKQKTVAPNLCSLHFGCYRSGTSGAQRLGVFSFSKQPIATKQKSPLETREAETRKAILSTFS